MELHLSVAIISCTKKKKAHVDWFVLRKEHERLSGGAAGRVHCSPLYSRTEYPSLEATETARRELHARL